MSEREELVRLLRDGCGDQSCELCDNDSAVWVRCGRGDCAGQRQLMDKAADFIAALTAQQPQREAGQEPVIFTRTSPAVDTSAPKTVVEFTPPLQGAREGLLRAALRRIEVDTVLDGQAVDYYKRILKVWASWASEALRAEAEKLPQGKVVACVNREPTDEELEIGRKAIEDRLIEMRDCRISELGRANGCVVREKDGSDSSMIRFGPDTALLIGIKAMLRAAQEQK